MKVCNFLKSRAKDIRVTARDTLNKIVMSLGPRYFPYVLSELRGTLRRGYQVNITGLGHARISAVFSSFVYIYIAIGDPVIKKGVLESH